MTFAQAKTFHMPYGKYQGRTLDDIASTDTGLLYLDWLRGETKGKHDTIYEALCAYLDDATIAREVASLL